MAEAGCDGFWKIYHRLRNGGYEWNHKRVYRVYKAIHFNKRVPLRKHLPAREKNPLETPERENVTWSMGFVTDVLQSNRKFRVLNVINGCDHVAVAQKVAPSMPANCVIRFLEEIIWEKGKPDNIRGISLLYGCACILFLKRPNCHNLFFTDLIINSISSLPYRWSMGIQTTWLASSYSKSVGLHHSKIFGQYVATKILLSISFFLRSFLPVQ